jgi:cytochrome c2
MLLLATAGKWTYDELNGFLKNPKQYIAGTKMSFAWAQKI